MKHQVLTVLCNYRSCLWGHKTRLEVASSRSSPYKPPFVLLPYWGSTQTTLKFSLVRIWGISWVQGAWNHCQFTIWLTSCSSLYSALYSEARFRRGSLRPHKITSGKHSLKCDQLVSLGGRICPAAADRKEEAKGFRKLTSSESTLRKCVSSEIRYFRPKKKEMAKWVDKWNVCACKPCYCSTIPALLNTECWAVFEGCFSSVRLTGIKTTTELRKGKKNPQLLSTLLSQLS